jgi:hypothetical protein
VVAPIRWAGTFRFNARADSAAGFVVPHNRRPSLRNFAGKIHQSPARSLGIDEPSGRGYSRDWHACSQGGHFCDQDDSNHIRGNTPHIRKQRIPGEKKTGRKNELIVDALYKHASFRSIIRNLEE